MSENVRKNIELIKSGKLPPLTSDKENGSNKTLKSEKIKENIDLIKKGKLPPLSSTKDCDDVYGLQDLYITKKKFEK